MDSTENQKSLACGKLASKNTRCNLLMCQTQTSLILFRQAYERANQTLLTANSPTQANMWNETVLTEHKTVL